MSRKTFLSVLALSITLLLLGSCGTRTGVPDSSGVPLEVSETSADSFVQDASAGTGPFVFTRDNFPRLDGSASTVPFAQALASVLLGEPRDSVSDLVRFSKTARSYRALMDGDADLILSSEPSPLIWAEKDDGGYDWEMSPFAVDALVFIVNAGNPIDSLTPDQLRGIYSGEITNWAEVGGEDLEITAFQRDAEAGSQTAMETLVMEGAPMADAPTETVRGEMGAFIDAVAALEDSPAAIGYEMYYCAHNMNMAGGMKILAVDGVTPNAETIRNGSYPFLKNYYAVTDAGRSAHDPVKALYDWILSEDGQRLVAHEGYVPTLNAGGVA